MLQTLRSMWPQYDIDGVHNVWIVKPGDKSKGVGIAFEDSLDDILTYISDPATQDYIVQKYIGMIML